MTELDFDTNIYLDTNLSDDLGIHSYVGAVTLDALIQLIEESEECREY